MAEKYKPLGSFVIVKPHFEEVSDGGIVIPQTGKKVPRKAKVVAIGPSCKDVKVGDKILVPKFMPFLTDNRPGGLCILDESAIWAVIDEE